MTQKEALNLAFGPEGEPERFTVFLNENQIELIQKKAQSKVDSAILTYYKGMDETKKATGTQKVSGAWRKSGASSRYQRGR